MEDIIETLLVVIYNLTLIIGTAYLVQVCNWSGWWFLLTLCFLAGTTKKCKCCKKSKEEPKSKIIID